MQRTGPSHAVNGMYWTPGSGQKCLWGKNIVLLEVHLEHRAVLDIEPQAEPENRKG